MDAAHRLRSGPPTISTHVPLYRHASITHSSAEDLGGRGVGGDAETGRHDQGSCTTRGVAGHAEVSSRLRPGPALPARRVLTNLFKKSDHSMIASGSFIADHGPSSFVLA